MKDRNCIYSYPNDKEMDWVRCKVKQFKKRDPKISMSKVIIALIKEKMKDPNKKSWDPRH